MNNRPQLPCPATICGCGWVHRLGSPTACPFAAPREPPAAPPAKRRRTVTPYQVRIQDPSYRLSTLRTQARRRNLECEVTFSQFMHITTRPCYYCGDCTSAGHRGIDRRDNDKGYVAGNMVPCCSRCNYMKGTMTEAGFGEHVDRIYMHLQGRQNAALNFPIWRGVLRM